jgi:deoxyadenosine/deoxycytidine kinase
VFARINLDPDEFELYQNLFSIIHGRLPKPDLLLFLYCSPEKSLRQIKKRGRDYEQEISTEYLDNINRGYLEFFKQQKGTKIVVLDTNQLDFVKSPSDLDKILSVFDQDFEAGIQIIETR